MVILVIDNDKKFLEKWVDLLQGFHPVKFLFGLEGESAADLHQKKYDLALIDRRAADDDDHFDKSGENFAIDICKLGTPSVLVTSFPPTDVALFELLRTGAISGIANKSIEANELLQCVNEFEHSRRFPNCIAQFYLEDDDKLLTELEWNQFAKKLENVEASGIELSVLFRSLIPPCAREVRLKSLTPGHGGAALFHATVSSGDGPVKEEVAIKYGDRATIRSEAVRYDRHVGPLPDGVAAHLRWRKETRTLGAIAYSWVGDSLEDGLPFGPVTSEVDNLTWRRRHSALARLFSVALNPWYRVFRSSDAERRDEHGNPEKLSLLNYYCGEGFSREVPFLNDSLPDVSPAVSVELGHWNFEGYGRLPNPVKWLTEGPGSQLELARYAPCHGDLHVKNIFVLPDDSPRLIDFGDTALGHVFRDFAALEASVRLTCANTQEVSLLKKASDCASITSGLGEYINHRPVPREKINLRKTLVTTMQIRRAALDAVSGNLVENGMKEYLFALIIRLLRYASGIADEVSSRESASARNARIWHALYAAAVASEQAINLEPSS